MLYFLVYIGIGIWVYLDAKRRLQANQIVWPIATCILGPVVVPFYLAKRNLKQGEVREGGTPWNIVKYFAMFWTLTMFLAGISGMAGASEVADSASSDAERAGAAIGTGLGMMFLFALWFIIIVSALVFGLFVKKSSVIENGPTGPLAHSSDSQADS